jgi:acetoin utilization deacetylase AcuC-like enzyme
LSTVPPILTFYTPYHALHNPPHEFMHGRFVPFFEMPARIDYLKQGLEASGLIDLKEPELIVTKADIARVHDPAMVDYFEWLSANVVPIVKQSFAMYHMSDEIDDNTYFYESMFPRRLYAENGAAPRYFIYDSVSPVGKGSWQAILSSANLAFAGALAVLDGEKRVYAMCRPPGHHAGRDFAGGYCYINNAAVAAAKLLEKGRVAIVDVDYHHGNGTQDIFWNNPDVFFVSLHGDPAYEYPFYSGRTDETGGANATGTKLNVPLPAGTDDDAYLAALEMALKQVREFQPTSLVVSLGFDTYKEDPIAEFRMDMTGYHRMGSMLAALDLPSLYVQEGGYRKEKLGDMAAAFFKGVTGHHF